MKAAISLSCALLWSCTFGGSDEDPTREIPIDGGDEEHDDSRDAEVEQDGGPPDDDDDDGESPETCSPPPMVAVCDPVRNTGCALTQCDVDTESATLAGRCVFFQPALGATCSANALSESCMAGETCSAGSCRKLCWCTQDCAAGECCRGAPGLGKSGSFKLCGPC